MSILGWIVIGSLSLLFFLLLFVVIRPFNIEITQDRPIIKFLCELQYDCKTKISEYYPCHEDISNNWAQRLYRWKGFNGCNNLTKGFNEQERGFGGRTYLSVEACTCTPFHI